MDVVDDAPAMFPVGWPVTRRAKILESAEANPEINRCFVRTEKWAIDLRRPHAFFVFRDFFGGHGGDRLSPRSVTGHLAANAENRAIIMAPGPSVLEFAPIRF